MKNTKSNARPVPLTEARAVAILQPFAHFTDFMRPELVLRCLECEQVLQVADGQMQAFKSTPEGCYCLACHRIKFEVNEIKNQP